MYPSEIFIVDADGSNLVQLTDNDSRQVDAKDYFYTNPLWSPDGSRVAYTRLENPYDQVLVVDAGRSEPQAAHF